MIRVDKFSGCTEKKWIVRSAGLKSLRILLLLLLVGCTPPPDNRWEGPYIYLESLVAAQGQKCIVEGYLVRANTQREREYRLAQLEALRENYRKIAEIYNSRMEDAELLDIVAPPELPRRAPELRKCEVK